ncbi:MAG: sensor histidine kinase [Thermoplasmatota archaeon]
MKRTTRDQAAGWSFAPLAVTAAIILASLVLDFTVLAPFAPLRGSLYGATLIAVVYASYRGGVRIATLAAFMGSVFAVWQYVGLVDVFPVLSDRVLLAASVVLITAVTAYITGRLSDEAAKAIAAAQRLASELRGVNRDLSEANRSLRAANESLDAFAHVVSHDLKEPIRATLAYAEELRAAGESELSPENRDLLRRTVHSAERLEQLTKALIAVSRTDVLDPSAPEVRDLSLAEIVSLPDAAARFEHVARERHARIEPTGGPNVRLPPAIACQIFGNFILNGVRHNSAPDPHIRLTAIVSPEDPRFVEVRVEDNGRGFPEAAMGELAFPGRSGASLVERGLGMTIAARWIFRLGGRVWIERSEALGGGCVRFTLPGSASGPLNNGQPGQPTPHATTTR